jgi:hypothetical protein
VAGGREREREGEEAGRRNPKGKTHSREGANRTRRDGSAGQGDSMRGEVDQLSRLGRIPGDDSNEI